MVGVRLYDLIQSKESVSFIGMCKNAGKTTTLNQVIWELHKGHQAIAITSVGRDGESNDLVTHTQKPGIYVYQGSLIATARDLLEKCDITKEILDTTGIHTPLGEVVILRALSDGFVQVAGPSLTSQLEQISRLFRKYTDGIILIDGALERKSISTSKVSSSTFLCTGASYDKNMDKVVLDTAYTCKKLCLPRTSFRLEALGDWEEKYLPLNEKGQILQEFLGKKPHELWSMRRNEPLARMPQAIYVQGGLTDAMIRPLLVSNASLEEKRLLFKDGSRILLSREYFEKLSRKGLIFQVFDEITLLGITINPFSAYGFHFDPQEFYGKMKEAVDLPVFDVRKEYGDEI